MRPVNLIDLLTPLVLSGAFLGMSYLWARGTRRGKPLTKLQRRMVVYSTAFICGATYAILFQDHLGESLGWRNAWIAAIVAWAAVLVIFAYAQYRNNDRSAT
jgi:hypothetical protein